MSILSNEELVEKIRADDSFNSDYMAQLYEQNKGYLHNCAKRYLAYAEYEDLMQEGYFGLWNAAKSYNAITCDGKGASFIHYAKKPIMHAMYNCVKNNRQIGIPRKKQEEISECIKTRNELCEKLHRQPKNAEIAEAMGISIGYLGIILFYENLNKSIVSYDAPSGDDNEDTYIDLIPSDDDVEGNIIQNDNEEHICKILWKMVDDLDERKSDVIKKHYRSNRTLEDISKEMKISKQRVAQIEAKALKKIRKSDEMQKLINYLPDNYKTPDHDDVIYSRSIKGSRKQFERTWISSTEYAVFKELGIEF